MKLNGFDVGFDLGGQANGNAICAAITGKTINAEGTTGIFGASDPPHYVWNGSAWAPQDGSLTFRMTGLSCNL
jgi:hypothetical protein